MIYNLVLGRGYMQASFFVRKMAATASPGETWAVLDRPEQMRGMRTSNMFKIRVHYLPGSSHNRQFKEITYIVAEQGFEEIDVGEDDE